MRFLATALMLLALNALAGCAPTRLSVSLTTAVNRSGRAAWLHLQTQDTQPWVVFVCRPEDGCSFFALLRSDDRVRIRWQDGDSIVLTDGTERTNIPDANGYIPDVAHCTRPFVGEVTVTAGMRGDATPVQTYRFVQEDEGEDADCWRAHYLTVRRR